MFNKPMPKKAPENHSKKPQSQQKRPVNKSFQSKSGTSAGEEKNLSHQAAYERMLLLAKEAHNNGDPLEAERCYQKADHYLRLHNEARHEARRQKQKNQQKFSKDPSPLPAESTP